MVPDRQSYKVSLDLTVQPTQSHRNRPGKIWGRKSNVCYHPGTPYRHHVGKAGRHPPFNLSIVGIPLRPPDTFTETMQIPVASYRTAIAIKNVVRMHEVTVVFSLKEYNPGVAIYSGRCPRCQVGNITVYAKINPDGGFSERPACPTLCIDCEERLDEILEPARKTNLKSEPSNRTRLDKYIRGLSRTRD